MLRNTFSKERVILCMEDIMAKQHLEMQTELTQALARLDLVETKISSLEESVNTAVATLMPKVDSLLSGRTQDHTSGTTSTPPRAPLPQSVLNLAKQGDGEALLQLLAVEDVDVHSNPQKTDQGDTALHVAASGGHLKAVVVLLGLGFKVDASGHLLRTPLHCAAAHGHLAIAQRLLDAGAKVDAKDADGATPLDLSASLGFRDVAILLLQKGAQPNEKSISTAAENGHWNLVELFSQNGDLINACNKEGHPLIVLSAKSKRWDMVELLLEKGASATKCKEAKESALFWASKAGEADAVRQLLRRGAASVNPQMEWAITTTGSASVVWVFVNELPDSVRGKYLEWGLVISGRDGRLNSLLAFLEAGVNINGRYSKDWTSLHLAAFNGQVKCLQELLRRGADITLCDLDGNTPLHKACINGHVECARALLDAGASTTEKNKEGKTPLEVATSDDVRALFNKE